MPKTSPIFGQRKDTRFTQLPHTTTKQQISTHTHTHTHTHAHTNSHKHTHTHTYTHVHTHSHKYKRVHIHTRTHTTVIAEIFVCVKISYSSIGELLYATNFRTASPYAGLTISGSGVRCAASARHYRGLHILFPWWKRSRSVVSSHFRLILSREIMVPGPSSFF